MTFATMRDRVRASVPDWLRSDWGDRWTGVVNGLVADMVLHTATIAVRMGWVQDSAVPPDALYWHGADRGMPRYPVESDTAYTTRLEYPWVRWEAAGSYASIINELTAAGLDTPTLTLADTFDPGSPDWSRYKLAFGSTHGIALASPWTWDSFVWDSGWRWGVTDPQEWLPTVDAIVEQLNPVRWRCVEYDFDGVIIPTE